MKIRAYAKINLALDVVSRREDGYHDLKMIMAPITLHDLIYIDIINQGIVIECNNKAIPTDQRNIMYRVAEYLIDHYKLNKGVKMTLYKHIPSQAGLAGGSADGAAILKAMNTLFKLKLSNEELAKIGKTIGADIPFCVYEKIALVEGIGEKLQFINQELNCHLLLVKPSKGVSTKTAFNKLDIENAIHKDCHEMQTAIINQDYQNIVNNLQNTLEQPAFEMVPEIKKIKDKMIQLGFDGSLMSGSGSCVFGITQDENILNQGYKYFKNKYRFVKKSKILNQSDKKNEYNEMKS